MALCMAKLEEGDLLDGDQPTRDRTGAGHKHSDFGRLSLCVLTRLSDEDFYDWKYCIAISEGM